MADIGNINRISDTIIEIRSKGENLADYEIQHTKSGFQLRERNSIFTKISKWLHPEQYNLAQNITVLAQATKYFIGKTGAKFDEGTIYTALTTILQGQVKAPISEAERKALKITSITLTALGVVFAKKKDESDSMWLQPLLRGTILACKSKLKQPDISLPKVIKDYIDPFVQVCGQWGAPRLNPAAQKLLEKEYASILTLINQALDKATDLPFNEYEAMYNQLCALDQVVVQLAPRSYDPQIVTDCLGKLVRLKSIK